MRVNSYKLVQEVGELKIVSASKIGNIAAPLLVVEKETINQQSFTSSFESLSVYHILKQQIFAKN